MSYDAFISYSHVADSVVAPKVHDALLRFAKPWWRRRALRVFRDNASLSADPALWSTIKAALDDSRYFVLLASPKAASSRWVAKEIDHWRATKPPGTLIAVLTDGTWVWDEAAGTFDWTRSTAVPRALDGYFTEEPRHVDLSGPRTSEQLDLRHSSFRTAVAEIAAPLHGVPRDEIEGADVRRHRQTKQVITAVIAALVLLAGAAGVGALLAVRNADEARAQTRVAVARQLTSQALLDVDDQLDRGLLLALEANRTTPLPEAAAGLLAVAQRSTGLQRTFFDNTEVVESVAVSPDGKLIATGAADGAVRLYDADGLRPLGVLAEVDRDVRDVRFSPDGSRLVTASVGRLQQFDVATRTPLGEPIPDAVADVPAEFSQAHGIAFAPGGEFLVAYGGSNALRYYATATGAALGPPEPIGSTEIRAAAMNVASVLIVGSDDGTITVLYPDGRPPRALSGHTDGITSLAVVGQSQYVLSGSDDGTLRLWDVETGELVRGPYEGHTAPVTAVGVAPDGLVAVSAGRDRTVRVWDVPTARPLGPPLAGHHNWVSDVAIGPGGSVASSGWDATVRRWTIADREPLRPSSSINDLAVSPDGRTVVTGGDDGVLRFFDAESHQPAGELAGHTEPVHALAFSRDGTVLASAGGDPDRTEDARIRLWDVRSRTLAATLDGHTDTVRRLSFHPNGRSLVSGADDGRIQVWDIGTREITRTMGNTGSATVGGLAHDRTGRLVIGGPALFVLDSGGDNGGAPRLLGNDTDYLAGVVSGLAVSDDGATIAVGSLTGTLTLWDAATGRIRIGPVEADTGPVRHLAFTPDGRTLATTGDVGGVRLWDAISGSPLGEPLAVHGVRVDALAFTPDGSALVTGGAEGLVLRSPSHLWDTDVARQTIRLCEIVGRNLSQAEWTRFLGAEPYHRTCAAWPDGT